MAKSSHEQLIGRTIAGKFEVQSLIGSGAMGAVFRARQVALDKTVAIKVLHGEHAEDATFVARFHREAKAASRLNHPNSMQVIDFGVESDGLLYIAMEYLAGRSLHEVIKKEWPLPAPRVADILMQTLAAIAVAHDLGIVHRDLKPENIMVLPGTDDDGRPKDLVKVCDFGIAKITDPRAYKSGGEERDSNAPVTTAGFLVGTPEYMSPEQCRGEKLDTRSDLYSVGVILYQLLTRSVPFEAENAIGVVLKHITEEPTRPSTIAADVNPTLEEIALRAMQKLREARFDSARQMRAELRAVAEGRAPAPKGPTQTVKIMTETPGPASAATVQFSPAPEIGHAAEGGPKATLVGTTSAIAGLPSKRRAFAIGASVVAVAAVLVLAGVRWRSHRMHATAAADDPAEGPASGAPVLGSSSATPPPLSASADGAGHTGAHGLVHAHGSASAGGVASASASTGGRAALSGSAALASAAPSASAAPAVATAGPSASAPAAASTATAAAPDPDFDPERGFMTVGFINAQGVNEKAVRGSVMSTGLGARCYKPALKQHGSAATGVATANFSFDENGVARAVVGGADFLPGLGRCIQGALTGLTVAKSQITGSGGGTAEVSLVFQMR
jgi:serine/threonine protein kinase